MKELDPYDVIDTDERTYCWHHMAYENSAGVVYRICGECHHVYRTPEDIVRTFNEEGRIMAAKWNDLLLVDIDVREMTLDEGEHIGFCPHCLHDW
jgi:hypothetical protein